MKTSTSHLMRATASSLLLAVSYTAWGFYDPTVGRWISRDPIEERGGKNLIGFVNNNPVNLTDLLGMFIDPDAGAWGRCLCMCRDVQLSFSPGGTGFQWGWKDGGSGNWRHGTDIKVVWTVVGNPRNCVFSQSEKGAIFAYPEPPDQKRSNKAGDLAAPGETKISLKSIDCDSASMATYTDYMGIKFRAGDDKGGWLLVSEELSLEFKCSGTGQPKSRVIVIPSSRQLLTFPPQ